MTKEPLPHPGADNPPAACTPTAEAPGREILHVDMDAFFVSVEEALNPSLKGKPVIVGGDPDGRGVVAAASYPARRYGIHSAMPLARARRLCPEAIFLRGSHKRYSEFSRRIFALLGKYSPKIEPMSLDEAYVDLTGCTRLNGPLLSTAENIRNEIHNSMNINASIGIASNKLLAKVASAMAKPCGMLWVPPGMERLFLAPLPVGRIPGVGKKSGQQLARMGIKTIADLALLPKTLLQEVYGKWGSHLYYKTRGICDSPVVGEKGDSRSISRETTFETDTTDRAFLKSQLSLLVEQAAAQLRHSGMFTRSVTVKIRYSDFKTVTRGQTLAQATCQDYVIFKSVSRLAGEVLSSRRSRVRLIGVALTALTASAPMQTHLFENLSPEKWDHLYRGIDRIRNKYGFGSILRGASKPGRRTKLQGD